MKSNTKIEKQLQKKTNLELVKTIITAKKHKAWNKIVGILSGSRKNRINKNLGEIKEDCIVAGKVLSQGEAGKHKIIALSFSEKANEKINKAGGKSNTILKEIKLNPEMKGLKVLK